MLPQCDIRIHFATMCWYKNIGLCPVHHHLELPTNLKQNYSKTLKLIWNPPILGKRSLTPPNFQSKPANSISYENWHLQLKDTLLRLLRLKLWSREVAKVARVQAKKLQSKTIKSTIFELYKSYTPQKKAESNRHSELK